METLYKTGRIREFGIKVGTLPCGIRNKITDVPGVKVGHSTIQDKNTHTGVTVILPGEKNPFTERPVAAAYVHNGFGKTTGLMQVQELGMLETPIALTNTLNVGKVWDALTGVMMERCRTDNIPLTSVNPLVGECNDSFLNDISLRAVTEEHVRKAITDADVDFDEGSIGAGCGTLCFHLKGGIGSASRLLTLNGKTYTLGVLVQTNFGRIREFILNGRAMGEAIYKYLGNESPLYRYPEKGSIMIILATDLPVNERQLYRMIRRCPNGIARLGGNMGHGSGEICIGFSTANHHPAGTAAFTHTLLPDSCLDQAFIAAGEAVQEAILNSMTTSPAMEGFQGNVRSLAEFMPLYKKALLL